jgi:polysaccharide biosynthesis protein PslH
MRVLLVTLELPFPPSSGYRLHYWRLIQALAGEGHGIVLVSLVRPEEAGADLAPLRNYLHQLELVPLSVSSYEKPSYLQMLRALVSSYPYSALRYLSEDLAGVLRQQLASGTLDVVICDQIYGVVNLPREFPVPVIVDTIHVAYILLQRYAQHFRNPLKRLYSWIEAQKMRRWEAGICRRVAAIGVCSRLEGEFFRKLCPGARVVNIPNVVDVGEYRPTRETDERRLLYCGAMDWYPNQDAVWFFASEILPEVQKQVPDVKFVVAGRRPSDGFRKRFSGLPAVEFTGSVPDMLPEFARAAVFVVPLRIASGTRIKILEAAAMARPIVSTRVGAEGLDFVDGEEIVLADDPTDFTRAAADLLTDPERRRRMGQAARRRVEAQYSMRVLRGSLRETLENLGLSGAAQTQVVQGQAGPVPARGRPQGSPRLGAGR